MKEGFLSSQHSVDLTRPFKGQASWLKLRTAQERQGARVVLQCYENSIEFFFCRASSLRAFFIDSLFLRLRRSEGFS